MVTLEKIEVNVCRLHFIDESEHDQYQIVLSKNIDTVRYYAKKLMNQRGWFLVDFYELTIYDDHLWLTRYIMRYKVANGKIRRRTYCITDTNRHFNQIL
jgi:hypothetical protein